MNNSVDNKTKNKIEFLVLKNFIMALKQRKMYPFFRGVVGYRTTNPISNFYAKMPGFRSVFGMVSSKNAFINVNGIDEMINMMKISIPNEMHINSSDECAKIQARVANCVNALIHVFIESHVRDLKTLESIGGSIFENTCREIFGNDFKDVLPPPPRMPEGISNLRGVHELNGNINWDEIPTRRSVNEFWDLIFNENE